MWPEVWSEVFCAQIISRSIIRWAGLKKCRPIIRPGLSSTEAISVIGNAEVLSQIQFRLTDAFEFFPYILLDLHVFEHSFDDQVSVFGVIERCCQLQLLVDHCVQISLGHLFLFFMGVLKGLPYGRDPSIQGLLVDVPEDRSKPA